MSPARHVPSIAWSPLVDEIRHQLRVPAHGPDCGSGRTTPKGARFHARHDQARRPKFAYKRRRFQRLKAHATDLLAQGLPVVLAGGCNVMPTHLDVYIQPAGRTTPFSASRRARPTPNSSPRGWTDAVRHLHPGEAIYTFWDYLRDAFGRNAGLSLDHLLLNELVASRLTTAGVDKQERGWDKTSDYARVWIELSDETPRRRGRA
jgi:exodeoxyribonuclease-3